jgi:hypothetical protein
MAGALQPFWFRRGHWSEGRRWLEESLAMNSGATQNQFFHAKALYEAGMLARFQGDFARARMLCEQCLALYHTLADQAGVVMALVQLGRISGFQDDQTAAQAFLAEAASLPANPYILPRLPAICMKANAFIAPSTTRPDWRLPSSIEPIMRCSKAITPWPGLSLMKPSA